MTRHALTARATLRAGAPIPTLRETLAAIDPHRAGVARMGGPELRLILREIACGGELCASPHATTEIGGGAL